jgi:protein involved in temperature-dependent protein secretion
MQLYFSIFKVKGLIERIPADLDLCSQFDARYTPHFKLNAEHIIRLELY